MAYVQRGPSVSYDHRNGHREKSLGDLFSEVVGDVGRLVRNEIALARLELTDKASRLGRDVGFLVAGGLIAYAGFIVLLGGVALVLAMLIPLWASALLVGIGVMALGGMLAMRALNGLRRTDLAPTRTMETLREDVEWAKEQTR